MSLAEIIKMMEAAALERNQKLCFEYVQFEMPIRHSRGSATRHLYMSLEHGQRSELESSVHVIDS